jgi:hypothetical protein
LEGGATWVATGLENQAAGQPAKVRLLRLLPRMPEHPPPWTNWESRQVFTLDMCGFESRQRLARPCGVTEARLVLSQAAGVQLPARLRTGMNPNGEGAALQAVRRRFESDHLHVTPDYPNWQRERVQNARMSRFESGVGYRPVRGRLTAGRHSLEVVMVVRIHPSEGTLGDNPHTRTAIQRLPSTP